MVGLIWTVIVLLAILWFLGFAVNIGWWIHLLLVIALLGIVHNLLIAPIIASRRPAPVHAHDHEHHDYYRDEI